MDEHSLRRRDFHKLSLAAVGGILAATSLGGCGTSNGGGGGGEPDDFSAMLEEPHVCRGLNTCEGHGAAGDNACAGMGACATAAAHGCHGMNECKGQGGCGESVGINDCAGKGECGVPLSDKAWAKARPRFEQAMTDAGKSFGDAPPKG